jgi:Actin like proteins N terminal domain
MVAIHQPIPAGIEQISLATPTGADIGAGLIKLSIGSGTAQMRIRMPSKIVELKTPLLDDLTSKEGGHFLYHNGDRADLIGKQFLVGDLANHYAPTSHIKLSDDPVLKAEYALHAVLGALASLPHCQEWNLFLVISTHSRELFKDKITSLLSGVHSVSFGGKDQVTTKVKINLGLVVPEGLGAYSQAKYLGLIDPQSNVIGIDFGTATVIPQIFAPQGKLISHQPLEVGGAIDLLDAIASDTELLKFLGSGKRGSVELIRLGIEDGSFLYGSRQFNFKSIYSRHLKTWLGARIRLSMKAVSEWRDSAQSIVAWGGGVELPGVSQNLKALGITPLPDGGWANAIGLQTMAQGLLARKGN